MRSLEISSIVEFNKMFAKRGKSKGKNDPDKAPKTVIKQPHPQSVIIQRLELHHPSEQALPDRHPKCPAQGQRHCKFCHAKEKEQQQQGQNNADPNDTETKELLVLNHSSPKLKSTPTGPVPIFSAVSADHNQSQNFLPSEDSEQSVSTIGTGNTYNPEDTDQGMDLRQVSRREPHEPYQWGSDPFSNTQEVGCDTLDLAATMHFSPFLLNFSRFQGTELNIHVGLLKRYNLPYIYANTFVPPGTDDYNREVFRFLKNHPKLKVLKLVLEVHRDDDPLLYKVFDDDYYKSMEKGEGPFPLASSSSGELLGNLLLPKALSLIPKEVTVLHVELPGLSWNYLDDWRRFLEAQRWLVTLICNFGSVLWTFYANVVENCHGTLEKVVIRRVISYDVKSRSHFPLDFGIFRDCWRLKYLKITGGNYREKEGRGFHIYSQENVLFHLNFGQIAADQLEELHYNKMTIETKLIADLWQYGKRKRLKIVCPDCPDREYYDDDKPKSQEADSASAVEDRSAQKPPPTLARWHQVQEERRMENTNRFLAWVLIICIFAFLVMAIAIGVAIAYSHRHRQDLKRTNEDY